MTSTTGESPVDANTSHMAVEVAGQPDDWQAVVERLPAVRDLLPEAGARVAVVGCGTSYYMAQAYAALREGGGHGETDAFAASEARLDRAYDVVLTITRSGTTTEVLEVLRAQKNHRARTVAVVATQRTPAIDLADCAVVLPEFDERSVVQTRFATTAFALLRASLGEDLSRAVADARDVLSEPEDRALAGLRDAEQVTFLGSGWSVGLAEEAALKLRESNQFWAESYPAMEYRHGPISIAAPGRVVWALGAVPDGLPEQVAATGARFEHRQSDALAELVRVHRLCLAKARDAGLDPDHPRSLTRSVVLAQPPA